MAELLATGTALPLRDVTGALEAVLAEALFASAVQFSQNPGSEQVRQAVAATLRRLTRSGCAAHVATEFGDHPETAGARMTSALAAVRAAYRGVPPIAA